MAEKLYLKQNVVVEPLMDQWYAWSYLIPPATAAMNIVGRHLAIMDSYVSAPDIHAAAVQNPAMRGGPFIDYPENRVKEVQEIIARTKQERAHMIELAQAMKDLDDLLRKEAKGFSLEPLYCKVPDILKGYVELVYDLNNQPSFRLVEALFYKSRYYNPESQSLMLSLIEGDDRPFILSTPRLEREQDVHLKIPFAHPGLDELFRMKKTPQTFDYIRDYLGIENRYEEKFRSFLTTEPPAPYTPYTGDGVRWRYFGHACILLETSSLSILLDPVLSYTYESDISRYTYDDLPDQIDYVLITHNHQDHILFETLLQIRHKVKNIVVPRSNGGSLQDPSLRLLLQAAGFKNIIELDEMETIPIPGGNITGLPFFGEHADLNVRSKIAHLIKIGSHTFLLAADSCNIEPKLYEHVRAIVGDIDVLFLGMECDGAPLTWLYGPLLTTPINRAMDQSRRLAGSNFERGRAIIDAFHCKEVYVYAMGQEPWLNYVMSLKYTEASNPIIASNKLIETCRERNIVAERLFGEKEILLS